MPVRTSKSAAFGRQDRINGPGSQHGCLSSLAGRSLLSGIAAAVLNDHNGRSTAAYLPGPL